MKYLILLLVISLTLRAQAQAQSQFRYEGYIENGGTPVTAAAQRFTVTLRKPGCPSTLGLTTWDSGATIAIVNGEFNLVPSFNEALLSVAMDPNQIFGCSVGSARDLEITWVDQARTFLVALQDAPRSSFSNLAGNSNTLNSRSQDQFLKIDTYVGQTPLSVAQVNSLLNLVNGTSTLYSNSTTAAGGDAVGTLGALSVTGLRGRPVGAAVPAVGQVLKFDGTSWMPSADDAGVAPGNSSYAASGLVRFDTSAAVSGIDVTAGVARLADTIVAGGPVGTASTIPVISYDSKGRLTTVTTAAVNDNTKLPLAGGTLIGPINMGLQNITNATSVAATNFSGRNLLINDGDTNVATLRAPVNLTADYSLTLPMSAPTNGFVLSTDAAGQLSWIAASTGTVTAVGATAPILSTGGTTPTISLNTGLGTNQVPTVGGTALSANGVVVTNAASTALATLNCALNQVIKFDASGFAFCGTDDAGVGLPLTARGDLLTRNATTEARLPVGTNGQILSANSAASTGLEWINPSTGDITSVNAGNGLLNGGVSGDVTLDVNTGLGAGQIPQVSAAIGMNRILASNGTGTGVTPFSCAIGQVIKFDASGFAVCGADDLGGPPFSVGGTANIFLGQNSGGTTPSGTTNVGVGVDTLFDIIAGTDNTAIGYQSGRSITSGIRNTLVGSISGLGLTNGVGNTFIGTDAGSSLTNGTNNTFIGVDSGQFFTSGNDNVILGSNNGNEIIGQSNRILISDGSGNIRMSADGAGQLGIGVTNPLSAVHISRDFMSAIMQDSYYNTGGSDSTLLSRRARGTRISPSPVQAGDFLGGWGVVGYDGVAMDTQTSAGIYAVATEPFSSSNNGTQLSIFTTENGSNSKEERIRITSDGNVGIGTIAPAATLDVNGSFRVGGSDGTPVSRVVRCTGAPGGFTALIGQTSVILGLTCPGVTPGMIANCTYNTPTDESFGLGNVVVQGLVSTTSNAVRFRLYNISSTTVSTGPYPNVTCLLTGTL